MKKIIILMIVMCLFFSFTIGQNLSDSIKIDSIKLHQYFIILKHYVNFHKNEISLEYGGRCIFYTSQPSISFISVMEAANSEMDFGDSCTIIYKTELEHCYIKRGFCPLKGYYRSDYYKGTRITISYANVSECECPLFDYILDSVNIVKIKMKEDE
jgi:hypothetical protein